MKEHEYYEGLEEFENKLKALLEEYSNVGISYNKVVEHECGYDGYSDWEIYYDKINYDEDVELFEKLKSANHIKIQDVVWKLNEVFLSDGKHCCKIYGFKQLKSGEFSKSVSKKWIRSMNEFEFID